MPDAPQPSSDIPQQPQQATAPVTAAKQSLTGNREAVGAPVQPEATPVQPSASAPAQASAPQATAPTPIAAPVKAAAPVAPVSPAEKVDSDEKLWGAISYIPMVALVSLLIKPKSKFIHLHGRQGLLIFGIFFASIFLYLILPPLGPLVGGLVQLAMMITGVYSAVQAFMGHWWKIPVLGDVAQTIPVEMFSKVATEALTGQQTSSDQTDSSGQKPSGPS